MKLSIIVPVFNMAGDGKLEYCLNSLVNQTIDDYEIIAVDDCSTDNSLEILRKYESKYPDKFKVIASPVNKKQGGAKNLGLEIAQGEWIGFIDSDDWITPDYYEKLLKKAEETGADMVGCDYHLTGEHSMEIGQIVHNNKPEQMGKLTKEKYQSLLLDSGSLVVKIYRRHIIFEYSNRFPEGIFYEDNAIGKSWMLRAKRFEYIQEPMYYYYHREGSITTKKFSLRDCEILNICDRLKAFVADKDVAMAKAAKAYGVVGALRVILNAPVDVEFEEARNKARAVLKEDGYAVLMNPQIRTKSRIGLMMHLWCRPLMRLVYSKINRWK